MIYKYISRLCGMLEIPIPRVAYGGHFLPPKKLAALSEDGSRLYLKKQKTDSLDRFFEVAAELRAFARRRGGKEPSETDSYAFAAAAMSVFFDVEPLFDGMTFVERERISIRRREIIRDELPQLNKVYPNTEE